MDIINDCGLEKADVIGPEHLAYRAATATLPLVTRMFLQGQVV